MNESKYAKLYCTVPNNTFDGNGTKAFGWWSQQDPHDLGALVRAVSKIECKKILEIGAHHGGTLVFWDHLVGPEGITVGIESSMSPHTFSMFNPEYCSYEPVSDLYKIPKNSHDNETFEVVKSLLDGSVDFLFLDGDHSYEGVKLDYEMYGPLVRAGGIIGVPDAEQNAQVSKFWKELEVPKELTSERETRIGIIKK